jgi:hypothetical protein
MPLPNPPIMSLPTEAENEHLTPVVLYLLYGVLGQSGSPPERGRIEAAPHLRDSTRILRAVITCTLDTR